MRYLIALLLAACSTIVQPPDGDDEAGDSDTESVADVPADMPADTCCDCVPEGHDTATPWTCLVSEGEPPLVCLPEEHDC